MLLAALLISFSFVPFLALAAPHCGLVPPEFSARVVKTAPFSGGNDTVDAATGWYPGWLGMNSHPVKFRGQIIVH